MIWNISEKYPKELASFAQQYWSSKIKLEFVFSNLDFLVNYLKSCQKNTMWWPSGGMLPGQWKKTASCLPVSGFGTHLGCSTFLCTKTFSSVASILKFLQSPLTSTVWGLWNPLQICWPLSVTKKHSEVVISAEFFFFFSLCVFWVEQLQDLLLYRVLYVSFQFWFVIIKGHMHQIISALLQSFVLKMKTFLLYWVDKIFPTPIF